MESPRKFNDCYFYYYSTCTKGDNCVFRHEPSALGCETMCPAWQQGKCLDKRCKLRHMELRKNRKQIPCYWENQPGGCRKKHCPFMHKNPEARTDGIAPSQPVPPAHAAHPAHPAQPQPMPVGAPVAAVPEASAESAGLSVPTPMPVLWQHQQQRQVVLDSAILGVLPASSELLGGRRVMGGMAPVPPGVGVGGEPQYGPLPVDPLVVNFEEESDNESAPATTPTKQGAGGVRGAGDSPMTPTPDPTPPDTERPPSPEEQRIARTKSQELLLLEKIQAEAAAFYSYDPLPPIEPPKERKIVRTNLSTKYDRLSLDELAGSKQANTERRKSLDFKILSLEEIRARKKSETIIQTPQITLNLNRKRKTSTHETVTSSGNKIIKVVRSNSIVYKKVDPNATIVSPDTSKTEQKLNEEIERRKRTLSAQSLDVYDMHEDELLDDCHDFKRIKVAEQTLKPRLIRNRDVSQDKLSTKIQKPEENKQDESDSEVQIVSVDLADTNFELSDSEVLVIRSKESEPVDIVDLSDDDDDVILTASDLPKNVPDVVASCQKKIDSSDKSILNDIDSLLNDSAASIDEEL